MGEQGVPVAVVADAGVGPATVTVAVAAFALLTAAGRLRPG